MKIIDLRSDTVSQPTPSMKRAMAVAKLGDDVFGEDPTVNELEELVADRLGKEASIYVSSGTLSNLLGLLCHCGRGDEYIVGQTAHTYKYEGGGAAVLGSIQPQPLAFEPDGSLDLDLVEETIKPDDFHFARTRLVCLENTQNGKVLPMDYLGRARALTQRHGLGLHLDGARAFNAAVKLGVPVSDIAQHFDSISVCLSKGLGAPVGSVLCGAEDFIADARRWRKMLGGGMRQIGVIAAGGIVALNENVERLADDHDNAKTLALGLAGIDGIDVDPGAVETNFVYITLAPDSVPEFVRYLNEHGVKIRGGKPIRLVTHIDISSDNIGRVIELMASFFSN
jgi:threonine aldolase